MRNEREYWIEELLAQKGDAPPPVPAGGPDCPSIADLMDVSLGQAGPQIVARVEEHAGEWSACRARLAAYREAVREDEEEAPLAGELLERVAFGLGNRLAPGAGRQPAEGETLRETSPSDERPRS